MAKSKKSSRKNINRKPKTSKQYTPGPSAASKAATKNLPKYLFSLLFTVISSPFIFIFKYTLFSLIYSFLWLHVFILSPLYNIPNRIYLFTSEIYEKHFLHSFPGNAVPNQPRQDVPPSSVEPKTPPTIPEQHLLSHDSLRHSISKSIPSESLIPDFLDEDKNSEISDFNDSQKTLEVLQDDFYNSIDYSHTFGEVGNHPIHENDPVSGFYSVPDSNSLLIENLDLKKIIKRLEAENLLTRHICLEFQSQLQHELQGKDETGKAFGIKYDDAVSRLETELRNSINEKSILFARIDLLLNKIDELGGEVDYTEFDALYDDDGNLLSDYKPSADSQGFDDPHAFSDYNNSDFEFEDTPNEKPDTTPSDSQLDTSKKSDSSSDPKKECTFRFVTPCDFNSEWYDEVEDHSFSDNCSQFSSDEHFNSADQDLNDDFDQFDNSFEESNLANTSDQSNVLDSSQLLDKDTDSYFSSDLTEEEEFLSLIRQKTNSEQNADYDESEYAFDEFSISNEEMSLINDQNEGVDPISAFMPFLLLKDTENTSKFKISNWIGLNDLNSEEYVHCDTSSLYPSILKDDFSEYKQLMTSSSLRKYFLDLPKTERVGKFIRNASYHLVQSIFSNVSVGSAILALEHWSYMFGVQQYQRAKICAIIESIIEIAEWEVMKLEKCGKNFPAFQGVKSCLKSHETNESSGLSSSESTPVSARDGKCSYTELTSQIKSCIRKLSLVPNAKSAGIPSSVLQNRYSPHLKDRSNNPIISMASLLNLIIILRWYLLQSPGNADILHILGTFCQTSEIRTEVFWDIMYLMFQYDVINSDSSKENYFNYNKSCENGPKEDVRYNQIRVMFKNICKEFSLDFQDTPKDTPTKNSSQDILLSNNWGTEFSPLGKFGERSKFGNCALVYLMSITNSSRTLGDWGVTNIKNTESSNSLQTINESAISSVLELPEVRDDLRRRESGLPGYRKQVTFGFTEESVYEV
ncbi:hypothetical protein BB560_002386 [Smittium megazygosporum]|uniref:Uncharacterized protein n=1 Tax=Smittium megazygosporum TaxID=133381 RepID=A0A2T9ZEX4_9FUNG|nr:hypothetical protein BB560_002386 [Smittium megazygosporum]